jgi:hypothetical protein
MQNIAIHFIAYLLDKLELLFVNLCLHLKSFILQEKQEEL